MVPGALPEGCLGAFWLTPGSGPVATRGRTPTAWRTAGFGASGICVSAALGVAPGATNSTLPALPGATSTSSAAGLAAAIAAGGVAPRDDADAEDRVGGDDGSWNACQTNAAQTPNTIKAPKTIGILRLFMPPLSVWPHDVWVAPGRDRNRSPVVVGASRV